MFADGNNCIGMYIMLTFLEVKDIPMDSTNEEVATVSNSGLVNAKEPGVTIIRLKLKKKSTGEYLMVAPVVLTVQEKTEE